MNRGEEAVESRDVLAGTSSGLVYQVSAATFCPGCVGAGLCLEVELRMQLCLWHTGAIAKSSWKGSQEVSSPTSWEYERVKYTIFQNGMT